MSLFRTINYRFGFTSLMLATVCLCANVFADYAEPDESLPEPHKIVQDITNRLLLVIGDEQLDPIENPDAFYQRATEILEAVVALDYIAKGVMGNYAEQITPEQRLQFTEAFKKGLVNTYSKGVAGFVNSVNIATLKPEADISKEKRVAVIQEIISNGTTTTVSYTMAKNRDKQWKLINVVLNGVNLGKTFRGQFDQAVKDNQGDVVKVINDWGKDS